MIWQVLLKKKKNATFSFKSTNIPPTQTKEEPKSAPNVVDNEDYKKLMEQPVHVARPSARGSTELKLLKEKMTDLENRLVYLEKVVKQKDKETIQDLYKGDSDL